MTIVDVGRTNFQDGMRVAREHLDHLQAVLLGAADVARRSAGIGKVCFGLQVKPSGPSAVTIGAGAAVDHGGRLLLVADESLLEFKRWTGGKPRYVVLKHTLRAEAAFAGVPTLYHDEAELELRADPAPGDDDAAVIARLDLGDEKVVVTQRGEWFLAPQQHAHSGEFVERDGLWRYDGDPIAPPPARFDSGFLPVGPGVAVTLVHDLVADDLRVELQARRADGVVTSAGAGTHYWYELAKAGEIRLVCGDAADPRLELRALIWPLGPATGGPVRPVANAGPDLVLTAGDPLELDGGASRAFGGRQIRSFTWTKIT